MSKKTKNKNEKINKNPDDIGTIRDLILEENQNIGKNSIILVDSDNKIKVIKNKNNPIKFISSNVIKGVDTTAKSLLKTSKNVQHVITDKMHDAVSGTFNAVNQTFTKSSKAINKSFDNIKDIDLTLNKLIFGNLSKLSISLEENLKDVRDEFNDSYMKNFIFSSNKKKLDLLNIPKFRKKDISKINYGMIHTLFGYSDGVSIVMQQIEDVMHKELKVPLGNIHYLVGKSKNKLNRIHQRKILWHKYPVNQLMLKLFQKGYGGWYSEVIELAIRAAQKEIQDFIEKNKIDVIIAHNSSHPENFISSIALSRYYRYAEKLGLRTPKYLVWWHDSHLERPKFEHPAPDVKRYLLEGVPGMYVEYILFINTLQFTQSQKYFKDLDKIKKGYYEEMHLNHDVIYNTTDTFIESFSDLRSEKDTERVEQFIEDFKIRETLKESNQTLKDALFCLQHTRIVQRKRIDFALKYCFELLKKAKENKSFKSLYFFVSGHKHSTDTTKNKLKRLHKKLSEEYKTTDLFLIFAEDNKKTKIKFEEYPRLFAKLGGFSTYFSEIEGFGNNLLEVLASGLIPVVYTYPVFVKDIAKYKFKVIAMSEFEIEDKYLNENIEILTNQHKRKIWVNRNLEILENCFKHKVISRKLQRAIIRRRMHA